MMSKDAIYDDGVLRVAWAGSPPVLALAGEIDESTYPGLVGALKEAADGDGEIMSASARWSTATWPRLRRSSC